MKIVIVGHIDHGKSTLIGRLLYDTNSIPHLVYEEVKKICKELGKKVEFAYFIDSLKEEREQNITIDTSQIFFKTLKQDYVIIDAPGHVEFMKNMITGASQAQAAVLIVDAKEGVKEQTKRHAYILSLLGLEQVIVVVNKMDSISYKEEQFNSLKQEILELLSKLNIKPKYIIPISAMKGDNVASKSNNMNWYNDLTVLGALDTLTIKKDVSNKPLRFPIQDVYIIDNKKMLVGRVESGKLRVNDEIVFLPLNKKSKISSIEIWNKKKSEAEAGESIGITINDDMDIKRGEIICSGILPKIVKQFEANIFCLSSKPIKTNEKLIFKCTTQEILCTLDKINDKFDSSNLENITSDCTELNGTEVGKVIIKTEKPTVIDNFNHIMQLGRFVLVKDKETVAGGIIPK